MTAWFPPGYHYFSSKMDVSPQIYVARTLMGGGVGSRFITLTNGIITSDKTVKP